MTTPIRYRLLLFATLGISACGTESPAVTGPGSPIGSIRNPQCLPLQVPLHTTDVAKDGIPALTNPRFVAAGDVVGLTADSRVVGVVVGEQPLAIPLELMWWHEIVNLDRLSSHVAVSYCPLTGSTLAFDRLAIGGAEFGVSGLLHGNNLVLYDREDDQSLWAQMAGRAICGGSRGTALPTIFSLETTWGVWAALYPDSEVASRDTGHDRNYDVNPYEDYWRLDAPPLIETTLSDPRRPPKELVLAIPSGERGGLAVPFGELPPERSRALPLRVDDAFLVAFWDGPSRTAVAHFAFAEWPAGFSGPSGPLTFTATPDGFTDAETGSTWTLDGRAVSGPAVGARLARHPRAYVAFWFAWAALRPETEIHLGS